MIKCILCGDAADVRDKSAYVKKSKKCYLHYCNGCAKMACGFGFAEKSDMEVLR